MNKEQYKIKSGEERAAVKGGRQAARAITEERREKKKNYYSLLTEFHRAIQAEVLPILIENRRRDDLLDACVGRPQEVI